MIIFPGFLSNGTKELAGNYDHVSRVPERRNQRDGWQLWSCFQSFWAMEPKSWQATMIMFPGFLSDGTKEMAGNYDHVSRVPEWRNQRAGWQQWSYYTRLLSDGTKELAGNYDHVSRVPEWRNQTAGRHLCSCLQCFWASELKSWPTALIMYVGFLSDRTKELVANFDHVPGFLSDGTKELAGNYDHVSRVPERRNQRAGRELWTPWRGAGSGLDPAGNSRVWWRPAPGRSDIQKINLIVFKILENPVWNNCFLRWPCPAMVRVRWSLTYSPSILPRQVRLQSFQSKNLPRKSNIIHILKLAWIWNSICFEKRTCFDVFPSYPLSSLGLQSHLFRLQCMP